MSRSDLNARPIIGSRVEIGAGAVVIGNVRIGDDRFIGANSVVSFDVPSGAIVRPPRAELVFSREPRVAAQSSLTNLPCNSSTKITRPKRSASCCLV